MGKVNPSWDDFWAWHENMPPDRQKNAEREADIPNLIKSLSAKQQIIVLKEAPLSIINQVRPYLKKEAKQELPKPAQIEQKRQITMPKTLSGASTSRLGEMLRERSSR